MNSRWLTIWRRWLGIKTILWRQFCGTTVDWLYVTISCGCNPIDRDRLTSRWLILFTQLDLMPIYDILDDLIRFPPY